VVIVDPEVAPGSYEVGGVLVLRDASLEMIGWAVTAKPIRVHDEESALRLETALTAREIEWRRWGDWAIRGPIT
jgi:hypothetical protein